MLQSHFHANYTTIDLIKAEIPANTVPSEWLIEAVTYAQSHNCLTVRRGLGDITAPKCYSPSLCIARPHPLHLEWLHLGAFQLHGGGSMPFFALLQLVSLLLPPLMALSISPPLALPTPTLGSGLCSAGSSFKRWNALKIYFMGKKSDFVDWQPKPERSGSHRSNSIKMATTATNRTCSGQEYLRGKGIIVSLPWRKHRPPQWSYSGLCWLFCHWRLEQPCVGLGCLTWGSRMQWQVPLPVPSPFLGILHPSSTQFHPLAAFPQPPKASLTACGSTYCRRWRRNPSQLCVMGSGPALAEGPLVVLKM